jgi:thiosulfate dehydrogenase [quinone] large subunit
MPLKDPANASDLSLAYLFLRATLGVNIMLHGVARLLGGSGRFVSMLAQQYHSAPLPHSLVAAFAYSLPWIEAALGLLVLVGLFTRVSLSLGALLILVLTFGSSLLEDWQAAGLQLVYAAVYAALLAWVSANRFSVDAFIHRDESEQRPA